MPHPFLEPTLGDSFTDGGADHGEYPPEPDCYEMKSVALSPNALVGVRPEPYEWMDATSWAWMVEIAR